MSLSAASKKNDRVHAGLHAMRALFALCLAWHGAGLAQSVQFFSPQGEVKGVRQVSARFAAQMVPFGDPRELDPFDIDCIEKGKGRWADMKNWVFDFDRDLPAGVRCTFTVKAGLAALDGKPLAAGQRFSFSTGGPAILRSLPSEDARIDENQIFILGLDAPAKLDTVAKQAYCVAAGINERIAVRVVAGNERRIVLDNRKSFAASYLRILLLDEDNARTRSFTFRLPTTGSDEDKFLKLRDAPDSPLVTLACARTLPQNVEAKLVWAAGIESTSGVSVSADQALAFKVRPSFRASFTCDRVNKDAQCIPILPLSLSFTARIAREDAAKIRLLDAAGKSYAPTLPKSDDSDGITSVAFGPGLPERQTFRIELPADLKDDAGRPLGNAASFPLKVRTDENPPLAKFPADFGILERVLPGRATPLLPVTLRNVEPSVGGNIAHAAPPKLPDAAPVPAQVARIAAGEEMKVVEWRHRLEDADRVDGQYDDKTEKWIVKYNGHANSIFASGDRRTSLSVPKRNGGKAFEVVGIPLKDPGFYVVELASPKLGAALLGEPKPFYVRTSTLVTNLGVHFKLGHEASLVWVTQLADGMPVRNASVEVRDCAGTTYWQGATDESGIARIGRELPPRERLPKCNRYEREYFVTARAGDDFSFAFSNWGEGIAPWRFDAPTSNESGAFIAHAVLDRSLFRAGETASMKIFVRKTVGAGFALVPAQALTSKLSIRHQGTDKEYAVPVHWTGAAHGEAAFAIPKDAELGTYSIFIGDTLGGGGGKPQQRFAGNFRVEAFRVPLMRARLQAVGTPLVNPADVPLDLQVSYLAGGGAGGLPVKLRSQVETKVVSFADYEGYAFAAGDVSESKQEQGDSVFRMDGNVFADPDDDDADSGSEDSDAPKRQRLSELSLALDASGGARAMVKGVGKSDAPRDMIAELEYRDPNGETLTAATRVALWPSSIVLGIKSDGWVSTKERLKFTVIALDLAGHPLANVHVKTDAFERQTYSHRRRLIGGFYAYEHGTEIKHLGDLCEGDTDAHGVLICEQAAPGSGNLILRARAQDAKNNAAVTRADAWVASGEDWWYAASDNDRIDLLPEKKRYEPGEVARFQLRTPFKQATALVTIEREGVLESFVRTIDRSNPVIEVPIKGSYAPNVFVSAFIVRGRIADVAPTALIDLAKPSFKMGLAEIRVGWAAHELAVKVVPARDVFKVRDKASIAVSVRTPDGGAPPAGSEVALAAVDEGLLELLPNDTWNLLEAMMTRRGEQVETSTAQMQVIGKRHFGRKAVAAGGGGGKQSARELFDTLLMWKAQVPLDAAGNAVVELPLNDSLTSFRIVAVASVGADLFGTGMASIRSTQDLMLLSGLPPLVRENDRFRALFTVRNASQRRIQASLNARITPDVATVSLPALPAQALDLAPGEAREVGWDVAVPLGVTRLAWQVQAAEASTLAANADAKAEVADRAQDALKASQNVVPAVPERTFQATILQLTEPQSTAVQIPFDALPGRGGVNVRMQAKLAGDMPGVREYLAQYPYSCFEQRTSVAIGLGDEKRWAALMRALPDYLDRDGLVKYWPVLRDGDDSLTAYVLSVANEAGWEIPDELQMRMQRALIGFVEGRVVRYSALPTADLAIRKIAALEALSRRSEAINAKWLDSISIEPNLWPTSAVIDWYQVLKRSPKLPRRNEQMKHAEQILRSRLNFQGTTMGFSTEKSDALWWLMVSADSNANRLVLALVDNPDWREDMPRLMRGTLGRMQHGRWNTTVANAWGTLALNRFSGAFEKVMPTGTTTATLQADRFAHTWKTEDDAQPFHKRLAWPSQRGDLAVAQDGTGAPWITLQSVAAIPLKEPLSSGYKITREVTPLQQKVKGKWSRGDVARIHLEIEAQSDMSWVVVDDPVPSGATALGRGLGSDSALLTQDEQRRGAVWPAFEERSFEAFRAYYRFVPKGRFIVEYSVRLNNPGEFHLPATHVEAMYAPEMFGEVPNADWVVGQ